MFELFTPKVKSEIGAVADEIIEVYPDFFGAPMLLVPQI